MKEPRAWTEALAWYERAGNHIVQGRLLAAQEALEICLRCCSSLDERLFVADVTWRLGRLLVSQGLATQAIPMLEHSVRLYEAEGVGRGVTRGRLALGEAMMAARQWRAARAELEGCHRSAHAHGCEALEATAQLLLGELHLMAGCHHRARVSLVEAQRIAQRIGLLGMEGRSRRELGRLEQGVGACRRARYQLGIAYSIAESIGDEEGRGWTLTVQAGGLLASGHGLGAWWRLARAGWCFRRVQTTEGMHTIVPDIGKPTVWSALKMDLVRWFSAQVQRLPPPRDS